MRLETSQRMGLEQRMKLAPRMIQSMEILQLPLLALQERIEQELISNPVLEMRDPSEDEPAGDSDGEEAPQAQQQEETTSEDRGESSLIVDDKNDKLDYERLAEIADDNDYEDYYSRARGSGIRHVGDSDRDRKLDAMANTAARDTSLHEYLTFQWNLVEAEEPIKTAGQLIINHLEDDGYLRVDTEELTRRSRTPVTPVQINRALVLVQSLDPPGVGARDLQECLLLQLDSVEEPPAIHDLARTLAEHHLRDIENNRLPAIAKSTGRAIENIKEAIKYLHRFDPRPGQRIGPDNVPYIVPDILVDYAQDGDGYDVRLASGNEPVLYINRMYRRMLRNGTVDVKTREFIKKNIQSARWLIESLEQRRSTLLRVAEAIVHAQRDFLDNGPKFLKPLPMGAVADKVGIHVATVSRAVSDKYMQCPRGIYPLRQFFSSGVETGEGGSLSWEAIKAKISEIIKNEDKNAPLSDDQIVDMLNGEGIQMARRTVAKYRKALGIPSARQRKDF
ncbi:MAG: RNA polymerase sigma-54 factor [Phycisphaerae bacterium]|nr:RNA polymerase sigma-54 factor [Phycisphaerae bacterium]